MASLRRFAVLSHFVEIHIFDEWHPDSASRRPRPFQDEFQQLTPEVIYDLLDSADKMHNAAGLSNIVSARSLLERMSREQWTCRGSAHEGGREGRRQDPYLHFDVNFHRPPKACHVRCRELKTGGLLVFQVTDGPSVR
ncbi:MAG: hypothetical protein JNL87_08855 [Burkholderiaceae bacterium]|nr:hypothetical protein [Burkholderiaceae bacterium]